MNNGIGIDTSKTLPPSLDYHALRREGIEHVQRLSGTIWTDYNLHDPGITILEYLCFGITDLAYRCNFPIVDLIYFRDKKQLSLDERGFYPIERILPCNPVTLDDYRKILIDQIEEVENVWVEPVKDHREGFKGMYNIRLQITSNINRRENDLICKAVRELFVANRNLGEDVNEIFILEPVFLDLEAEIHLDFDASLEEVLATVIYDLSGLLMPRIRSYSLEEMLAQQYQINELLEGPVTLNGFIKTEALQELPAVLFVSVLRDSVAAAAGVNTVHNFIVKINGIARKGEETILAPENKYYALSPAMKCENVSTHSFTFYRNGQPLRPNLVLVRQMLNAMTAREYRNFSSNKMEPSRPPFSEKKGSDISAYYSIQRFFPAFYGIGAYGLPRYANKRRQAQAKQLKGYLAVMETMLASYMKQITALHELFNLGGTPQYGPENHRPQDVIPTYVAAFPFDIPDILPLINIKSEHPDEAIASLLNNNIVLTDQALQRNEQFLDHLLARFGESGQMDALETFLDLQEEISEDEKRKRVIHAKRQILQDYVAFSQLRGKGFNYLEKNHLSADNERFNGVQILSWNTANVSGFKKRICLLLGFNNVKDRGLTDFFPFGDFQMDQLSKQEAASQLGIPLKQLIRYGRMPNRYILKPVDEEQKTAVVFIDYAEKKEYVLFKLNTEAEAKQKLQQFMDELKAFQESSKGFFVVEHLLLRPRRTAGNKLIFKLSEPNWTFVMKSPDFQPLTALNTLALDLLILASDRSNFIKLEVDKKFYIVLTTENTPALISETAYGFLEADDVINKVIAVAADALRNRPGIVNDWIEIESENIAGLQGDRTFYNHTVSLVTPAWSTLFSDQNAWRSFRQLASENAPAHLALLFHRLSWQEMKHFESIYLQWLEETMKDEDLFAIDRLSFELRILLTPEPEKQQQLREFRDSPKQEKGISPQLAAALFAEFGVRIRSHAQ